MREFHPNCFVGAASQQCRQATEMAHSTLLPTRRGPIMIFKAIIVHEDAAPRITEHTVQSHVRKRQHASCGWPGRMCEATNVAVSDAGSLAHAARPGPECRLTDVSPQVWKLRGPDSL